jgi:uroporphyrinogen III methyltransferase/synthase
VRDFVKAKQIRGKVFLVGAGSGDPGLLTVKGAKLLAQADVVVYDYLANPRLLEHCRADVEKIYVGKKAAQHAMTQTDINALLVKLGQEGKFVVRLKGGDPYVFGRGGEEGEALVGAGIYFETVPGITAAIAAPCYAGIPVTHRDFNSSFTLITGHEKEEEYKDPQAIARGAAAGSSDLDWEAIAKLPCVAFYMGVKALPRIVEKLIAAGKAPNTPAATIQWGTTPRQKSCDATIATIAQQVEKTGIGSPAITIIGKVVTLRKTLNWFENRPLFGQTIVVTRTRQQASDLSAQLEELGANVIEAPTIEIRPPKDWSQVDRALKSASAYDWIIFTSANGVTQTRRRLRELELDIRSFGKAKIASVGEATKRTIETELALNIDLSPESFVAEGLAEAIEKQGEVKGKKFLLLRADIARPVLREKLLQSGAQVDDISVYETHSVDALPEQVMDALREKQVNWITFTSSSTAKNFLTLLGSERGLMDGVKLASIGPVTSKTMKELSLMPAVEATEFNIAGLVEAIVSAK